MNSAVAPAESCDFCRAALTETHQHLIDPATRRIECVCEACAILFSGQNQKYRRIPRRTKFLPEFRMTDAQWDGMMIPIGIAFLVRQSASGKMTAVYPSPAGPVESLLPLEAWTDIETENPEVRSMEADVEGLLVHRVGDAREHYIVPIDECFRLIGIIRMNWKGLSGGMIVWQEIGKFLDGLKQKSNTR